MYVSKIKLGGVKKGENGSWKGTRGKESPEIEL